MRLNDILEGVCRELDVDVEAVKGKVRTADLINARRHYVYIAKRNTNNNLKEIAMVIRKTHAMTLHHDKKHRGFIEVDKKYARASYMIESAVIPPDLGSKGKTDSFIDRLLVKNQDLTKRITEANSRIDELIIENKKLSFKLKSKH